MYNLDFTDWVILGSLIALVVGVVLAYILSGESPDEDEVDLMIQTTLLNSTTENVQTVLHNTQNLP